MLKKCMVWSIISKWRRNKQILYLFWGGCGSHSAGGWIISCRYYMLYIVYCKYYIVFVFCGGWIISRRRPPQEWPTLCSPTARCSWVKSCTEQLYEILYSTAVECTWVLYTSHSAVLKMFLVGFISELLIVSELWEHFLTPLWANCESTAHAIHIGIVRAATRILSPA